MGFDPAFVGSGAAHRGGSVPDPGATAGTRLFVCENGTFALPFTFSEELSGGAGQIDFTAIPDTARHLRFLGMVRSGSTAGGTPVALQMTLNGSTTNRYSTQTLTLSPAATAPLLFTSAGVANILLCDTTIDSGTSRPTGLPVDAAAYTYLRFVLDIPYYSLTSLADKAITAQISGARDTSPGDLVGHLVCGFCDEPTLRNVAISRVTFSCASGTFSADSKIQMLGIS